MTLQLLLSILTAVANALTHILPLFQQGQAVISETDAQAVHTTLQKVEQASAALRPQVDQALAAAATA